MTHSFDHDIVVFCGRYAAHSTVEHIETIAAAYPHWHFTIFQEFPRRNWKSYLRAKMRTWRRQPLSLPLQTLATVANRIRWQRKRPQPESPVRTLGSLESLSLGNVQYCSVERLHDPDVIQRIATLRPWLGVSIGAPILRRALFAIPCLGTINLHKSLLPAYRGAPPGFWEIHDRASESGVSVHWVDDALDTGDIITQRSLPIPKYSTPVGLSAELDVLASQVLVDALAQVDKKTSVSQASNETRPNRQPPWLLAKRVERQARRRRRSSGFVTATLALSKAIVIYGYVVGCRLRNVVRGWRGTCHTMILLYHRIDDNYLDDVSTGVEQFIQHLEILKRHYDVEDVSTFLLSRGKPRRRPCVVITFDDGYANNLLAAILLRRAGLPCTFFISTRIVDSDNGFPHDWKLLGMSLPALTWSQIVQMKTWGFQISNHTAHHLNVGSVSISNAIEDIVLANEDLVRNLGHSESNEWFAYPYGKRSDMTQDVRSRLHSMGIEYCFSAYGGSNCVDFEPLNVLRQGVNYKCDGLRLRATIEGWKWRQ